METKTAFVFDMDGVLIDSERLLRDCLLEVAPADCAREALEAAFNETLGVTIEGTKSIVRRHMGVDFPVDACYEAAGKLYFSRVAEGRLSAKPGAEALLKCLHAQGRPIGLASSSPRALVEKELGLLGLLPYFDALTTGDMVKNSKPAPDIYLAACAALGVSPKGAYAVEDARFGVMSAHAAGLSVLGVPDMLPFDAEIRALCTGVFDSLVSVKDWLTACE